MHAAMRLTGMLLMSAALTCEAFMPQSPGMSPVAAHARLALSTPGPRVTLRRNGATQTRAHLDPTHVHHFADALQVWTFVRRTHFCLFKLHRAAAAFERWHAASLKYVREWSWRDARKGMGVGVHSKHRPENSIMV